MNLTDFLKENSLKSLRGNTDFIEFVEIIFNKYIQTLQKLEYCNDEWVAFTSNAGPKSINITKVKKEVTDFISKINIKEIQHTCNQILEALHAYYDGFLGISYKIIEELLGNNYKYITHGLQKFHEIGQGLLSVSKTEVTKFYRIRGVKEEEILLDKKDLFHVPFNEREKVDTYRYSINGYPCIYLGNSIKVCWNECNKPLNFYLTSIDISGLVNKKFLVFRDEPSELAMLLEKGGFADEEAVIKFLEFLQEYIYTFPIMASCSVIVPNKEAKFKPEYIISNILTQYIRDKSNEFGGIIYFSCKNNIDIYEFRDNINIVIPTIPNGSKNNIYSENLGKSIRFSKIQRYTVKDDEDIKKIEEEFVGEQYSYLFE